MYPIKPAAYVKYIYIYFTGMINFRHLHISCRAIVEQCKTQIGMV